MACAGDKTIERDPALLIRDDFNSAQGEPLSGTDQKTQEFAQANIPGMVDDFHDLDHNLFKRAQETPPPQLQNLPDSGIVLSLSSSDESISALADRTFPQLSSSDSVSALLASSTQEIDSKDAVKMEDLRRIFKNPSIDPLKINRLKGLFSTILWTVGVVLIVVKICLKIPFILVTAPLSCKKVKLGNFISRRAGGSCWNTLKAWLFYTAYGLSLQGIKRDLVMALVALVKLINALKVIGSGTSRLYPSGIQPLDCIEAIKSLFHTVLGRYHDPNESCGQLLSNILSLQGK